MADIPIHFRWRSDPLHSGPQYRGYDGKLNFGCFSLEAWGWHKGEWAWNVSGLHFRGGLRNTTGFLAGEPREIAAHIERVYLDLLPEADGLHLPIEAEVEHFERHGMTLPRGAAWRKAKFIDGLEPPPRGDEGRR